MASWADITFASADRAVCYHVVAQVLMRLSACALQEFIDNISPVSLWHVWFNESAMAAGSAVEQRGNLALAGGSHQVVTLFF
eukprot:4271919-Amphidinium_carterae.1